MLNTAFYSKPAPPYLNLAEGTALCLLYSTHHLGEHCCTIIVGKSCCDSLQLTLADLGQQARLCTYMQAYPASTLVHAYTGIVDRNHTVLLIQGSVSCPGVSYVHVRYPFS